MEPLFENRYIQDEAMIREFFRRTQLLSPVYILGYLCCVYFLLNFIFVWAFFGYCELYYLIFTAALLGYYWLLYHRSIKLTMNRELEMSSGKPLERRLVVTEDCFIHYTPTSSVEIPFDSVKKVRQSKNLILVCTKAKQAFVFPKATFTRGTLEEFLAFLKSKGIK